MTKELTSEEIQIEKVKKRDDINRKILGETLRARRERLKLGTPDELGVLLNVPLGFVGIIEDGVTNIPVEKIKEIALSYHLDVSWFYMIIFYFQHKLYWDAMCEMPFPSGRKAAIEKFERDIVSKLKALETEGLYDTFTIQDILTRTKPVQDQLLEICNPDYQI